MGLPGSGVIRAEQDYRIVGLGMIRVEQDYRIAGLGMIRLEKWKEQDFGIIGLQDQGGIKLEEWKIERCNGQVDVGLCEIFLLGKLMGCCVGGK